MLKTIRHSLRTTSVITGILFSIAGCGGPLSTASSIRVEVDVYKGPLSLELETQWAELLGVVNEAKDMLENMRLSFVDISMPMKNCKRNSYDKYETQTWRSDDIGMAERHCSLLFGIQIDLINIQSVRNGMLNNLDRTATSTIRNQTRFSLLGCQDENTSNNCSEIRKVLRDVSELAARFKAKALFWSQSMLITQPDSYVVRINMATFSSALAQYSNQLSSRADALLKQMEGKSRQVLPTSVYLRDTSTTDFPNLHAWNRAAAPALLNEMLFHPLTAFSSEETFDRIRVIERLFADHYWTNINTVYGSGQGEVRMALIKDDIGNWDLKSFDSDPTELVEAYTNITIAGLKAATAIGTGVPSSGALDFAGRLARGQIGSGGAMAGQFNVEALHGRVLTKLQTLKQDVAKRKEAFDERRNLLKAEIGLKDTKIKMGIDEINGHESNIRVLEDREKALAAEKLEPEPARALEDIEADLKTVITELESERIVLRNMRKKIGVTQEEKIGLEKELDFTQEKLDALPASIIKEMRSIIEDHEAVIDVLQESVIVKSPSTQLKN